ncbi:MAG: helix-turn-helix domain-containing protein [Bacteroidetes bacterium]|nr:helix-turn-helix domain-containing protein [Bacteroidota bacterium]
MEGTIVNWRSTGKLKFHKIGNRILFKREEILANVAKIKVYKSIEESVH